MVAEATGCAEETILLAPIQSLSELRRALTIRYPALEKMEWRIAVNQQLAAKEQEIPEGAEIALLPPYAGG